MKASIKSIQNSEFGIQDSEFRIRNSEFRIRNSELLLTFKSYFQWYIALSYSVTLMYIITLTAQITILDKGVLVTNKHPCVPPTLGRTSTLQSTSTPMEYLQRIPTLQVTHIPHSVLCIVGSTGQKKGAYFSRAKALAQEVLYGLCVILCAIGSTLNSTQELLLHKVPPILLNEPLSKGRVYSLCLAFYTSV